MKLQEDTAIMGKVRVITTKAGTNEVIRVSEWSKNRVMLGTNTGKSLILQRLVGINTYTLNIGHGDIGTGSTAPVDGNTQLQTAVARVAVTNPSFASNVASLFFFYSDAGLANGTYREFGSFVGGTASINTGQIFQRALFGVAYVKASGEDSTVQLDLTVS